MVAAKQSRRVNIELGQVIDTIPVAGFAMGLDGLITHFNRALVELLGRSPSVNDPADRYLKSFPCFSFNGQPIEFEAVIQNSNWNNQEVTPQLIVERNDKTCCHVELRSSALRDENGNVVGDLVFLGILTSELGEAGKFEEVSALLNDAEALNRNKNNFIATLAHELRNALVPILSGADLLKLKEGVLSPHKILRVAGQMGQQGEHISRLVDDLNDYTAMTLGKLNLHSKLVDMTTVCNNAIEQILPVIERRPRQLKTNFASSPVFVNGDETRLLQVVGNLLSNAVKFTNDDGIIEVDCYQDGEQVVVAVRDDGFGIPKSFQDEIFSLFVQPANSATSSNNGIGIGLALSKELMKLQNGDLKVKSEGSGCGSEFTIRLGLANSHTKNEAFEIQSTEQPQVKVLVIDDNESVTEIMQQMLEALKYNVVVANNGPDGIEKANDYCPDVVLCDIAMPEMSGIEFIENLKSLDLPTRPFLIAFSGNTLPGQISDVIESGFDVHLGKPAKLSSLRDLIERAVVSKVS